MEIDIEVPDLASVFGPSAAAEGERVLDRATVSELYFEQGDEIEEGELFAVLFNRHGTCEIVAPTSGVLVSMRYEVSDSVASEEVLATIDTDR